MSKKFYYLDANGFVTESLAFESSDFVATGGTAGEAGKPIILDGNGLIDASLINFTTIDHGGLDGLGDDDHPQYILVDGSRAFTGNQSMGGNLLTNVGTPVSGGDAVTKAYADALSVGSRMIGNVAVATTANITLSGLQTIDGYSVLAGDRVLVKDQTDPTENGVYVAGAGAWARSEDLDNSPESEILNGKLCPRVINGTVNGGIPFYISSVGTGTDGVHQIGVDNIVWDIFTSPTQLQEGSGITFNGNVVDIDLADTDPGLYFDGSNDLGIDWSTAFNDAKAVKASDLSSNANGFGASIIGIEDAGGYTDETDVEGSLQEIYQKIKNFGTTYTVGTGGVNSGDLVYVSANDTVLPYTDITVGNRGIGLALTTEVATAEVVVLANDTIIEGVLTGATAGDVYYWDGSALTTTIPSTSGQYVWRVGVAKNATDLHVEIEFVKKNV